MYLDLPRAAAATCFTGIIFPMYIYPGDGCSAWNPLITAIQSHPTVPFTLIVNPNSGPGGAPGSQPDTNYQACLPKLKSLGNPNVKIIGYVSTSFGNRAATDVTNDVDTYAQWTSTWRPDGIFFDEAPITQNFVSAYSGYSSHARAQTWASTGSFVALNPGTTTISSYYSLADVLVTYEDTFASFSSSSVVTDDSTRPTSKQSVIIHTAPTSPPTSTIATLVADGVKSIYITNIADDASTNFNPYNDFPVDWTAFVDALKSAGGC